MGVFLARAWTTEQSAGTSTTWPEPASFHEKRGVAIQRRGVGGEELIVQAVFRPAAGLLPRRGSTGEKRVLSASGRTILARMHLTEKELKAYAADTKVDTTAYMAELERVRRYATRKPFPPVRPPR